MSTFNGIVAEFPDIRVDFFRRSSNQPPPLACFLSHVHSDHLAGLESLRSPFVYCSAATREILLRLERYPCRINFAKGILEARVQTFKNLKSLLKPVPLETPTEIELAPGHSIQVTLLDANHCPGAAMFLIEGDGKAILYTGDIRSEPWHVNMIARSPALVEFTYGPKTLDKIYLDTSFIDNIPFQTKAEGIAELLQKVSQYPPSTVFHLQAWTYGYEDVWIALSKALKSRVHVDDYKMSIFNALRTKPTNDQFEASVYLCSEAPALTGFMCGNSYRPGCLTTDQNVRLHSCEKGNYCSVVERGPVVWIQPIIAHTESGVDRLELGVGGGAEDLEREAELDLPSSDDLDRLLQLLGDSDSVSDKVQSAVRDLLLTKTPSGRNISLDLDMGYFGDKNEADILGAFSSVAKMLEHRLDKVESAANGEYEKLPKVIRFPYSRHSSYPELCHFVMAFKPKDVWPCTVDPAAWVRDKITVKSLFGECCSGHQFDHDVFMDAWAVERRQARRSESENEQETQATESSVLEQPRSAPTVSPRAPELPRAVIDGTVDCCEFSIRADGQTVDGFGTRDGKCDGKRDFAAFNGHAEDSQGSVASQASIISQLTEGASLVRADAHRAMLRNLGGGEWTAIGLLSTTDNHTHASQNPAVFDSEQIHRKRHTWTARRSRGAGTKSRDT